MARSSLFCGLIVCLLLVSSMTVPAVANEGATVLGAGFSGKPFALGGDVVIETLGIYESIRDYEDAESPAWISWYDHPLAGIWRDIIHEGGLVVALRDSVRPGLEIVDLSDPSSPTLLAAIDGNAYTSGWLRGESLIVSEAGYLLVYDLSDPADPVFADFMVVGNHPGPRWFSDLGDRLYLVDHDATLRIFDITDPLQPVDLGTHALPGDRIDAMVVGVDVLYVLLATGGDRGLDRVDLVTYDLTTPLPQEIDRRLLSDADGAAGRQLMRDDRLLLAATSDDRVQAFDLTDPTRPAPGYELPLAADHLAITASRVFVMTGEDVQIYPRTDASVPPVSPVVRSLLPRFRTIDGEGPIQIGQLHGTTSQLVPIDATNPRHPRVGAPFDTGLPGTFIYNDGYGLMYRLDGAFNLFDLSVPTQPIALGSVDDPRLYFFDAAVTRDYLVLETGSTVVELRFYDLADPYNPLFRAQVYDYGLRALGEDLMICSRSNVLRIHDVSDPWNSRYLRQIEIPGTIQYVQILQKHAYVLTEDQSGARAIQVVRLTVPEYPELIAEVPLSHIAYRLDANEGRLYAVGYHLGQIFDVVDPAAPLLVAEFPAWGHTGTGLAFNRNVTTVGGWLIAVRDDGFATAGVPETAPIASRLELPFPNPLNPRTTIAFSVERSQHLRLTIHDVRGRRVAELASGVFAPGRHVLEWNGQDAADRPVASGVYLVRLHGEGLDASRTVTVVK